MFRGRSRHTLDDKGRLAIPARFKDALKLKDESCLVVTNHIDCLWAFAKDDWRVIESQVASLSLMDPAVKSYRRVFISGAQECHIKQGRITLPPDLRDIAGLNKEIMVVGELNLFEIWDKERWDKEFQREMEKFNEAGPSLSEFGI